MLWVIYITTDNSTSLNLTGFSFAQKEEMCGFFMCLIWLDPLGKSDIRRTPENLYQNNRKSAVSLFHLCNKFLPNKSCLPALNLCSIFVCTEQREDKTPTGGVKSNFNLFRMTYIHRLVTHETAAQKTAVQRKQLPRDACLREIAQRLCR